MRHVRDKLYANYATKSKKNHGTILKSGYQPFEAFRLGVLLETKILGNNKTDALTLY